MPVLTTPGSREVESGKWNKNHVVTLRQGLPATAHWVRTLSPMLPLQCSSEAMGQVCLPGPPAPGWADLEQGSKELLLP